MCAIFAKDVLAEPLQNPREQFKCLVHVTNMHPHSERAIRKQYSVTDYRPGWIRVFKFFNSIKCGYSILEVPPS